MTNFSHALMAFTLGFGSFRRRKKALVPAAEASGPIRSAPLKRSRRDREFLPAALEILESPPSPIHMGLILVICTFVAAGLTWSWIGRIDIVAVASGKIQPQGRVKTIQTVETGRIEDLAATNGGHVEAGAVLFTLDPADARADIAESGTNFAAFRAEALRRTAALTSAVALANGGTQGPAAIAWPADTPNSIKDRENGVLASDLKQLRASVNNLSAQLGQKRAERQRLEETIAAQSALVATLKERVDMRMTLMESGSGPRAAVLDARENYETQAANLAYQKGQRAENEAAVVVAQSEIDKAFATFMADNTQKREEAERQADDYAQKLEKARLHGTRLVVTSPVSGIVQGSTITTIGQVVNTGEEVMRIVPDGTRLEVEAYLPNKDVAFVQQGQEAVIKVETLPFTRYGTIQGKVLRVASDAIPEQDAETTEAAPARAARDNGIAGGQRTRNLVFPITIELTSTSVNADGRSVPLMPGMAVNAEIKTGTRRMLDYLLSPVMEVSGAAMKER